MTALEGGHTRERALLLAAAALVALLVWSGLHPHDRLTWLMEVMPVMIALPLMAATYRRMPLTTLLYLLIFVHACVLMLGGAYTSGDYHFSRSHPFFWAPFVYVGD